MSRPCELGPSTGVRATLETLVTAAALLAWEPRWITDAGFQLTFAGTLGILLLHARGPLADSARGFWPGLLRLHWAGFCAQAGVAPILIAVFGEISIVAPLANLVIVPVAAFAVSSGMIDSARRTA